MRMHTGILLLSLVLAPNLHADSLNGRRSAVTNVGDVNQDRVADLAVASRDRNRPERVWILSGKDGTRLLEIHGRDAGDRFGSEVVDDRPVAGQARSVHPRRFVRRRRRVPLVSRDADAEERADVGPVRDFKQDVELEYAPR